MPIKSAVAVASKPHINPTLTVGEVYILKGNSRQNGWRYSNGRCFTYTGRYLIWLVNSERAQEGGYDDKRVIEQRGLTFEVCTLQVLA